MLGRQRWLVIAAESITSIDVTAGDSLVELDEGLDATGVKLCFAEMKDPVEDKLKKFGLFEQFGETRFFPTLSTAVETYLESDDALLVSETAERLPEAPN